MVVYCNFPLRNEGQKRPSELLNSEGFGCSWICSSPRLGQCFMSEGLYMHSQCFISLAKNTKFSKSRSLPRALWWPGAPSLEETPWETFPLRCADTAQLFGQWASTRTGLWPCMSRGVCGVWAVPRGCVAGQWEGGAGRGWSPQAVY